MPDTKNDLSSLRVPEILGEEAQELFAALKPLDGQVSQQTGEAMKTVTDTETISTQTSISLAGPWLSLGNLTSFKASAGEQAEQCFLVLKGMHRT